MWNACPVSNVPILIRKKQQGPRYHNGARWWTPDNSCLGQFQMVRVASLRDAMHASEIASSRPLDCTVVYSCGLLSQPQFICSTFQLPCLRDFISAGGFDYSSQFFKYVEVISRKNSYLYSYRINLKIDGHFTFGASPGSWKTEYAQQNEAATLQRHPKTMFSILYERMRDAEKAFDFKYRWIHLKTYV